MAMLRMDDARLQMGPSTERRWVVEEGWAVMSGAQSTFSVICTDRHAPRPVSTVKGHFFG